MTPRWLRIPSNYEAPLEVPVEEWIMVGVDGAPAFLNSWVNYDASDGGRNVGFYRDPFGFVHLKGLLRNGSVGSAAFALPLGYRPEGTMRQPTISNDIWSVTHLSPAGNVSPTVGVNTWFDFSGINFRAVPERQVV